MRPRLARPARELGLDVQLSEAPLPEIYEEVCVYLVPDGWRWQRISAFGRHVRSSDRAFDFRTDAFSDARQNNPGLKVRKSTPPPF